MTKLRISFFITSRKHAALKMRALREGRSISDILRNLVAGYLADNKKPKKEKKDND
jgi:plasmid stability protein